MSIKIDDVFIYPTDTVWGIGSSITSSIGHARIAEIKKTSKNKPLSIMFASVNDIYNSFHFPEEMALAWLEDFFKLETTLGFPIKASKIKIPKWATGESDYVSIRSLNSDVIKSIYHDLQTPFFSTSLNLTGSAPIISTVEAFNFQKNLAPDAHFFESNVKDDLSGSSSTIVFFQENLDFEIKREGRRIEEVKNHLMKLFAEPTAV
ncbi:MAG: Sua5/YciO/YrdC/YwlC family protein [Bacteriovorax sp.]|nr:Sua5/YciO/YrdC/YwlC family protein [Bacteriovorax sp.]